MNRRIEHAAPFLGYLSVSMAAALFHLLFTPWVFAGARGINGSPFTPMGLMMARPLGLVLCIMPFVLFLLLMLSYRFAVLRSANCMAALGCSLALLFLLYGCTFAYPLIERGIMHK
jgi:hypothetical protein